MSFLGRVFSRGLTREALQREFIRRELQVTSDIFGETPKGIERKFFCLNKHTWIWHENDHGQQTVTKYTIRPGEIVKSVNDESYRRVSVEEAQRFAQATRLYADKTAALLYLKQA